MGIAHKSLRPKRHLAQYFLVDNGILEMEADLAEISPSETVLEIGPGTGNLTTLLARRARKVFAIEKDRRMASLLRRTAAGNVEVIMADALKIRFPRFDKLVGNIPYSISGPLLLKAFQHSFRLGVLCLQYEFALRMVAGPGSNDYSRLSVLTALNTEKTEIVSRVPRTSFYPVPKVDSAIVRFVPKSTEVDSRTYEVIRMMFCHKRKTVGNALRDSRKELKELLGLDWREVTRLIGAEREKRVFQLSPDRTLEIARRISARHSDVG